MAQAPACLSQPEAGLVSHPPRAPTAPVSPSLLPALALPASGPGAVTPIWKM